MPAATRASASSRRRTARPCLRVRISYSTTELGRRLRGQERVTLWGSNWRVVRGHAQERAEVMQAMLESEISYA